MPKTQIHITGFQARLARGLVNWTQAELALAAKVNVEFVKRLEADAWVSAILVRRIRRAFEAKRVTFEDGANPYIAGA